MNSRTSRLLTLATALLVLGTSACTDALVEPKSTVTGANIFKDPGSYRAFLAKIYAGLAVTGQQGPAGSGDIQGIDEGFSHYIRLLWQLQELPTDEAIIAWNDQGLPELNSQLWGSSNNFLTAMYYRIYFQVAMANEFLRETTDAKLTERDVSSELRTQIQQYRAEARFLRALSYWHGIDLFGDIPLVDENFAIGATPPEQSTRAEIFDFMVSELNAIKDELPTPGPAVYGRANRAAASMLLAKLYLNSEVLTGTARYAEARTAAEEVIAASFSLDADYSRIFLADNHSSPEIVFAVPQDGQRTQSFGGTTFLVHAAVGGGMNANTYGIDFAWGGLRLKPEAYRRYPATGDSRTSYFFTTGQTVDISNMADFTQGIAAPKYRNVTSTGQPGSHATHTDVDYPMFRLADAYLIHAEAVLRNGGGSQAQALTYVNALRQRAYGNTSGNITATQLTLDFILDERSRELLWEGHRRTDLIRFGRFTSGIWTWKGGIQAGRATAEHLDLYPIPASELSANPNLNQNPGY